MNGSEPINHCINCSYILYPVTLRIINYKYQIVFILHGVKQEWLCIKGYACISTIFAQTSILFHSVY